jgi:hypothetical protein
MMSRGCWICGLIPYPTPLAAGTATAALLGPRIETLLWRRAQRTEDCHAPDRF